MQKQEKDALTILETEIANAGLLDLLAPKEPERPQAVVHRGINDGLAHLDRVRDDRVTGEPRHNMHNSQTATGLQGKCARRGHAQFARADDEAAAKYPLSQRQSIEIPVNSSVKTKKQNTHSDDGELVARLRPGRDLHVDRQTYRTNPHTSVNKHAATPARTYRYAQSSLCALALPPTSPPTSASMSASICAGMSSRIGGVSWTHCVAACVASIVPL